MAGKLTFAIPTFGRPELLAQTARVLNVMPWLRSVNVRVYDDASPLSRQELRALYPTAVEICKRPENLGADHNLRQILLDFLQTADDALLLLDSDLIVSEKAYHAITESLPHTDGFLSIYNSFRHPVWQTLEIAGRLLDLKLSAGAAGSVLARSLVPQILDNVPPGDRFDWRMCEFLTGKNVRLFVTHHSYVQHLGFEGTNCVGHAIDFGCRFDSERAEVLQPIGGVLEQWLPSLVAQMEANEQKLFDYDQRFTPHVRPILRLLERTVRRFWKGLLAKPRREVVERPKLARHQQRGQQAVRQELGRR